MHQCPVITQPTEPNLRQQGRLQDALFAALEHGDGLPVALMLDAVLVVAASVCLNAGMSAWDAAAALVRGMRQLGPAVLRAQQAEPDVLYAGGPPAEA